MVCGGGGRKGRTLAMRVLRRAPRHAEHWLVCCVYLITPGRGQADEGGSQNPDE